MATEPDIFDKTSGQNQDLRASRWDISSCVFVNKMRQNDS